MNTPIAKTLIRSTDHYIQFTDEELAQLNISPGDKFSVTQTDDGAVKLEKHVPIEIDLSEFTKMELIQIIHTSVKEGKLIEDVLADMIEESLANIDLSENE